jgi:hypothetical protein
MQSVVINTTDTEAPLTANSVRTLTPVSENKTRVDVTWDIDMSNLPIFGKVFAKESFMKTTEEALKRYAEAVE